MKPDFEINKKFRKRFNRFIFIECSLNKNLKYTITDVIYSTEKCISFYVSSPFIVYENFNLNLPLTKIVLGTLL